MANPGQGRCKFFLFPSLQTAVKDACVIVRFWQKLPGRLYPYQACAQ